MEPLDDTKLALLSTAVLRRPADFLYNLKLELASSSESSQELFWQRTDLPETCLSFMFSGECPTPELHDMRSKSVCLPCSSHKD